MLPSFFFRVRARANAPLDRGELLDSLKAVLDLAFVKLSLKNTANSEKQSWARIVVNAVGAGTPLIRDQDLEKLKAEIVEIKAALNIR